jgi:hypothetical protein
MADKEKETELPWDLQLQNAIAGLAALWKPVWWWSMLLSDAKDRRRHTWRRPTLPHTMDNYVPAGVAPREIEIYLNRLGIQTAFVTLTWTIEFGHICLIQTILVPGRMKRYAEDAMRGYQSGKPFHPSGPSVGDNNLGMRVGSFLDGVFGHSKHRIGQRVDGKKKPADRNPPGARKAGTRLGM